MASANRSKSSSPNSPDANHLINVSDDDSDSVSDRQPDDDSISSERETDERTPCKDTVNSPFLDDLITRLMTAKSETDQTAKPKRGRAPCAPLIPVRWKTEEILRLCDLAIATIKAERMLLTITREHLPLVVLGDLHGQFRDLRDVFHKCGGPHIQSYLFLGDYVDRGLQGIEVMSLLLAIKVKYPSKVFLLRGNHEDGNTCMSYGFYEECQEKFLAEGDAEKVFKKFLDVFAWLPVAAVVDRSILCMHGGISPHLRSLDDIDKIQRPRPIPPFGLMTDLMWADPNEDREGWSMNPRGISFTFNATEVEKACARLGVELIVRAHQMTSEMRRNGYNFFAGGRLLTIFSAPNYLNQGNDGCLLRISKELRCRFVVLRVPPLKSPRSRTERLWEPTEMLDNPEICVDAFAFLNRDLLERIQLCERFFHDLIDDHMSGVCWRRIALAELKRNEDDPDDAQYSAQLELDDGNGTYIDMESDELGDICTWFANGLRHAFVDTIDLSSIALTPQLTSQMLTDRDTFRVTCVTLYKVDLALVPAQAMQSLVVDGFADMRNLCMTSCSNATTAHFDDSLLEKLMEKRVFKISLENLPPSDGQHYDISPDAILEFCFGREQFAASLRQLDLSCVRLPPEFCDTLVEKSNASKLRNRLELKINGVRVEEQRLEHFYRNRQVVGGLVVFDFGDEEGVPLQLNFWRQELQMTVFRGDD